MKNHVKFLATVILSAFIAASCTFKFEVTSQRTALENQVLGSYKALDDELVLSSSVRSPKAKPSGSSISQKVLKARRYQKFNLDDVDELKDKQIIGETNRGQIKLLSGKNGQAHQAKASTLKLARILVKDENRDRSIIWQHIIDTNSNLSQSNLSDVIQTFVKTQRENAKVGQWLQGDDNKWMRKVPQTSKSEDLEEVE